MVSAARRLHESEGGRDHIKRHCDTLGFCDELVMVFLLVLVVKRFETMATIASSRQASVAHGEGFQRWIGKG